MLHVWGPWLHVACMRSMTTSFSILDAKGMKFHLLFRPVLMKWREEVCVCVRVREWMCVTVCLWACVWRECVYVCVCAYVLLYSTSFRTVYCVNGLTDVLCIITSFRHGRGGHLQGCRGTKGCDRTTAGFRHRYTLPFPPARPPSLFPLHMPPLFSPIPFLGLRKEGLVCGRGCDK